MLRLQQPREFSIVEASAGMQRSSASRWPPVTRRGVIVNDIGSISAEVHGLGADMPDYSPSLIGLLIHVGKTFLPSSGLPAAFPFSLLRRER